MIQFRIPLLDHGVMGIFKTRMHVTYGFKWERNYLLWGIKKCCEIVRCRVGFVKAATTSQHLGIRARGIPEMVNNRQRYANAKSLRMFLFFVSKTGVTNSFQ